MVVSLGLGILIFVICWLVLSFCKPPDKDSWQARHEGLFLLAAFILSLIGYGVGALGLWR